MSEQQDRWEVAMLWGIFLVAAVCIGALLAAAPR